MKIPPRRHPPSRNSALTLLELLIVITILAILTTLAARTLTTVGDQTKFDSNEALVREFRRALLGNPTAVQSDYTPAISGFIGDLGRLPRVVLDTSLYAAEGEGHADPTPAGYNLPEMLTIGPAMAFSLYPLDINTLVWTNLATAALPSPIDTTSGCKLGVGWRGPYMQGFTQNYLRDSWGKPITAYYSAGSPYNFRYLVDWWVPTYTSSAFVGAQYMVVTNVDSTGFVSISVNPGGSADPNGVAALVVRGGPASSSPDLNDTYAGSLSAGIVYPNEYVSQLTVSISVGGGITNALTAGNSGNYSYATSNYLYNATLYLYSPNPFFGDPRLPANGYGSSRSYTKPIAVAKAATIFSTANYTNIYSGSPIPLNFSTFISQNAGAGEPTGSLANYPLVQGPKAIKAIITANRLSGSGIIATNVATLCRNIVLRPGNNTLQITVP